MDYKKKVEELRAFFLGEEAKEVKVELAEETKEEVSEPQEAAPVQTYVTVEQFNSLKEEQESFMVSVTEMLSKAMEMINATEKNTVPKELSKEEVVEEVVVELEEVAKAFVHDPEGLEKEINGSIPKNPNRRQTTIDVVMNTLWNN